MVFKSKLSVKINDKRFSASFYSTTIKVRLYLPQKILVRKAKYKKWTF